MPTQPGHNVGSMQPTVEHKCVGPSTQLKWLGKETSTDSIELSLPQDKHWLPLFIARLSSWQEINVGGKDGVTCRPPQSCICGGKTRAKVYAKYVGFTLDAQARKCNGW